MKFRTVKFGAAVLSLMIVVPTLALVHALKMVPTDYVRSPEIAAAASRYPAYTVEQHRAVLLKAQSQLHPRWSSLSYSQKLARIAMNAKALLQQRAATTPVAAAFVGNQTAIVNYTSDFMAMQRQADCSLTRLDGAYVLNSGMAPGVQFSSSIPHYEKTLHDASGLSTTANVFANGCADSSKGIGSRAGTFLGKTSAGLDITAWKEYDATADSNLLHHALIDQTSMSIQQSSSDSAHPDIYAIAAGDLNNDGLRDVVGLSQLTPTVTVWLTHADGTLAYTASYTLTGNATEGAVIGDFDGDGKADLAVVTLDQNSSQEVLFILKGKGDGTFAAPTSMNIATPTDAQSARHTVVTLATADFRGSGHLDIVGSNGVMLRNDGTGTFTAVTAAFSPSTATSEFAPTVAAADFNKDGKLDLIVGTGAQVQLYKGKGDGTFSSGPIYAMDDGVGYVNPVDLDGDGNLDVYVGLAADGVYAGDRFNLAKAYALMGNGDGTLLGAPVLPFVYSVNNLLDLNGDGKMDAVGVNLDNSFTTYLGDGTGGFTPASTLATSPLTLNGQLVQPGGIDSFDFADVDGDGKKDLIYIASEFLDANYSPGIFIAKGDGQGGFASPTFWEVTSTLPPGQIDHSWEIGNLHLADLNGDGKADLIYDYSDTDSSTTYFGTVVQLGNGDGAFQAPKTLASSSRPYNEFAVTMPQPRVRAITDFNHDGKPDLLLLTQTSTIDHTLSSFVYVIQVALGNGDGTFATPTTVAGPDLMAGSLSPSDPATVTVADVNGDGTLDIVALGANRTTYNSQVAVSLGVGDGTFHAPVLTDYSGQYLNADQGFTVGDFNGDGHPDIVITDPYVPTNSGISLGNGDGTFQTVNTNGNVLPTLAINLMVGGGTTALDLNGDGKLDLLAGNVLFLSQASSGTPPPPTPDFAVSISSATGTVTAGQTAQTTVTLTPSGGFNGNVSLSCSGLPAQATCSFSPASISVNGAAGSSTLTISTTTRTAMMVSAAPNTLPALLLLPFALRRRESSRSPRRLSLILALLLGGILLAACGGDGGRGTTTTGPSGPSGPSGTPAGTSSVTITATSGNLMHSTTFTLTVD